MSRVLFLAASWSSFTSSSRVHRETRFTCPPTGYDSVTDFNVTEYISGFWYSQMQSVTSYQKEENLFCVRANYTKTSRPWLFPQSKLELIVDNFARENAVDGPRQGGSEGTLRASVKDLASPSKLSVGPPFLPVTLRGDFWVVALGPSPYQWAIVTGGPPTEVGTDGCVGTRPSLSNPNGNGEGLWLFTREPVADEALVESMVETAKGLGLDTSVLLPVKQEGCCGVSYGVACPEADEAESACPPPGYDSVKNFDVEDYISRPWYIQKQALNAFQTVDQLQCVRANYTKTDVRPKGSKLELLVDNYSKNQTGAFTLQASVTNLADLSKLVVGPSFVPVRGRGDYWVVATGGTPYEWAIVSGGPPTEQGQDGCKAAAGGPGGNGEGLWLFTREPVAAPELVDEMVEVAQNLGLDTSVLFDVKQEGCCGEQYGVPCPEADAGPEANAVCPPPGFDSVKNFDIQDFISRPWYSQKQAENSFQKADELECVRAIYTQTDDKPRGSELEIMVDNWAARIGDSDPFPLSGSVKNLDDPSKLVVGPPFLPVSIRGDYWVVALGGKPYEWAIVTGGPPTRQGQDGCKAASASLFNPLGNGEGLWLFTREPVAQPELLEEMVEVVKSLGLDTSVLLDVKQAGCCGERYGVPCATSQ